MVIKSFVASLYLLFAYWTSSSFEELKMFFYPTLGAFCYFFISRTLDNKNALKIIGVSCFAATVSSILHYLSPGFISLFITCLLTIFMINFLNLNAAPIVAIVLIPYFTSLPSIWLLPVSVLCSLVGLYITLQIAYLLEAKWDSLKLGLQLSKNKDSMEKELTL